MRREGDGNACMLLCRAVRENRRETLYVNLDDQVRLFCDERAYTMGRALGHNTVVRHLQIPVTHLTASSRGTQALAKVLQSNQQLVRVEIVERFEEFLATNRPRYPMEEYRRILAVVDCFLGALSQNQGESIRFLKIPRIFGPLTLASCLVGLRHSITEIYFELPHSAANSQETANSATLLGEVMASLHALKTLRVDCSTMNWDFFIPFLCGLCRESKSNTSLRSLLLWNLPWWNDTEPVVMSIQHALIALPNLECFHLHVHKDTMHSRDQSGGLGRILRGLQDHPRLRFLQLAGSRMVNEQVVRQVAQLLEHNHGGIKDICLDCDRLVDFCAVVAALETNTTLEKLRVVIQNQEEDPVAFAGACETLSVLWPRVAVLKELELVFAGDNRNSPSMSTQCAPMQVIPVHLLRGFCGNRSLVRIHIEPRFHHDIPDPSLNYYCTRNYWSPRLAGASRRELPAILESVWTFKRQGENTTVPLESPTDQSCLSLTFETLRTRFDWLDTAHTLENK